MYADLEADNEIDKSSIGKKTTNLYEQFPVLNGFRIEPELDDILKSGYHKSLLGYNNVDWFVNEVIKLENKMAFFIKNTNKDIIMTKKDGEDYRNNNIYRFCKKKFNLIKLEIIVF